MYDRKHAFNGCQEISIWFFPSFHLCSTYPKWKNQVVCHFQHHPSLVLLLTLTFHIKLPPIPELYITIVSSKRHEAWNCRWEGKSNTSPPPPGLNWYVFHRLRKDKKAKSILVAFELGMPLKLFVQCVTVLPTRRLRTSAFRFFRFLHSLRSGHTRVPPWKF